MTKVSVVGAAGTVGAAAGYNLALRDVVDELVFVDIPDMEDKTVGQAADTNHGIAYDSNTEVYQGTYEDTAGSDVVVITAGIPRKEGQTRIDLAGDNAPIMEDIGSSLAEHVPEARGVQTAAEADDLVAVAVAALVEVAVQEVDRVRRRHRHEVVVVLGERRADVLHDGRVVAREVGAGLAGLARDAGRDDDDVRARGVLVAALVDLGVGVVRDTVVGVRGLSRRLVDLVRDVDEDEFVGDVSEREIVACGGADRPGGPHDADFRHIT